MDMIPILSQFSELSAKKMSANLSPLLYHGLFVKTRFSDEASELRLGARVLLEDV